MRPSYPHVEIHHSYLLRVQQLTSARNSSSRRFRNYSDGSSKPLSGVTWTTSDPRLAKVNSTGFASAFNSGPGHSICHLGNDNRQCNAHNRASDHI